VIEPAAGGLIDCSGCENLEATIATQLIARRLRPCESRMWRIQCHAFGFSMQHMQPWAHARQSGELYAHTKVESQHAITCITLAKCSISFSQTSAMPFEASSEQLINRYCSVHRVSSRPIRPQMAYIHGISPWMGLSTRRIRTEGTLAKRVRAVVVSPWHI
jgi:hypothetical protein